MINKLDVLQYVWFQSWDHVKVPFTVEATQRQICFFLSVELNAAAIHLLETFSAVFQTVKFVFLQDHVYKFPCTNTPDS